MFECGACGDVVCCVLVRWLCLLVVWFLITCWWVFIVVSCFSRWVVASLFVVMVLVNFVCCLIVFITRLDVGFLVVFGFVVLPMGCCMFICLLCYLWFCSWL